MWNWTNWTAIIVAILTALLGLFSGAGCIANDLVPRAFPQELSTATNATAASLVDQADWERILARLRGHVLEPGMETYVRVETAAGARIAGVDADLLLEGDGQGVEPLSDDMRAVIVEMYGSATSKAQRDYWLTLLGNLERGIAPEAPSGMLPPGETLPE